MVDSTLSSEYRIAETDGFRKTIQKSAYLRLYAKIVNHVYPQLRRNPHFGPNIKKLKGEWANFYRYRIGDYRLFYQVVDERVTVVVIQIRDRKESYR